MSRRVWIFVSVLLAAMLLCGCTMTTVDELYAPPKRSAEYEKLQQAIDLAMVGMEYASPLSGENRQMVQMADLNGDGKTDVDDQLGLLTYALAAAVDPFVYSSIKFTTRDKDGFVQLNMKTDEAVALTEKLCAFFHQPAVSSKADGKQVAIFAKGNVLFLGNGTLSNASSSEMRDMENDFGVLPHPKGSEEQESYYSLVHDTAMVTAVPVTVKDTEKVGAVLEALAAQSYRTVTPAFFDVALKNR